MATSAVSTIATLPAVSAFRPDEGQRTGSQRNLIERAQRGDEEAFATLYQLHSKRVHFVCLRMTNNVQDAEDLTQEAFLQVFRNVNSFRGDSAFSTWLHRIAVNTVLMKLRRRKGPSLVSLDEPVSPDSPSLKHDLGSADPNLSGAVDRIALHRAAEELPPGCRNIFDLHEVEGYEHHEIADLLQCSIGNSKSQLHKAKMKLRDMLFPRRRRPTWKPRAKKTEEMTDSHGKRDSSQLSPAWSTTIQN